MESSTPTLLSPSTVMREQIERRRGIPRELYVDAAIFEKETGAVFNKSWMFVAHESQLTEVGQYVTLESAGESIVVTRTESGFVAFHNVCRHRGARVVDAGCGRVRRFTCPYHAWVYDLSGSLRHAPHMASDVEPAALSLKPADVAVWHGLVFARLTPGLDEPLDGLLRVSEELIGPFDIASARVAHTIRYDVAANWKLVWENSQECYHCSANHPELLKTFLVTPLGDPEWLEQQVRRSHDFRVQSVPLELRDGAKSLTMDGLPASSRPMGRFATGEQPYTAAVHLKPTFAMVCCPDYSVVLSVRPASVDRTEMTMSWLVHPDAHEGRDYDLGNLIRVWDETNRQDWALCERTQHGVASRYFEPGPLSEDESSVGAFHQAYASMLETAGL